MGWGRPPGSSPSTASWVAKAVAPAAAAQFAGACRSPRCSTRRHPAGPSVCRPGRAVGGRPRRRVGGAVTWVGGEPLPGADTGEQRVIVRPWQRSTRPCRAPRWPARSVPLGPAAGRSSGAQALDPPRGDRRRRRPRPAGPLLPHLGLLHADPAPEHFRLDPSSGRCGLIDWSVALEGPLLYDLASAVMYVGGPDHGGHLVEAYLRRAVVTPAEVERALPVLLRFRWAVQADYFARRIAEHDLTGSPARPTTRGAWKTPAASRVDSRSSRSTPTPR